MRGMFRSTLLAATVVLAALASIAPAMAQDERPTGYPRSANEGQEKPVAVSAVYTAEVRGVAGGGIRRGARYLDNLDLQVSIDAEKLVGWRGAKLFGYVLYNNGTRFSSSLVGDFQRVSNIETGVRAVRLFEAWAEQAIGSRGSVKAGLYNLNSEFDTTISGGLFLLSSHGIGPDFSQSGRNGPSIFPATSLAVRGEYAPDDHWLIRAAVLDGVPDDPGHPRRTAVLLGGREGALLVAEIDRLSRRTKLAVGTWRYTARFASIDGAGDGATWRDAGAYAFVERQLSGNGERGGAGLAGWARVGVADRRFNPVARYLGGGLVRNGIFGRSDDQLGVSVAAAHFGAPYRRVQRIRHDEVTVELAYRIAATGWLSLQPDLQWVHRPGGGDDIGNATVIGLRAKIGR